MGSDYEILTEKDMPYFRELVGKGQAVIIEIPEDVLMSLDIGEFEEDKEAAAITDEELLGYINAHKDSFIAAAERNKQILESTRALEAELMGTEAIPEMEEGNPEQEMIMPVAPLPASIEEETEGRRADVPERKMEPAMRDEEWKKTGGLTPMEMLDAYDREKEEQDSLRERRLRLRSRQDQSRLQESEGEEMPPRMEDTVRSENAEEVGRKTPPTLAQLKEAKEKARQLGYEDQVPMEILMMLLDVTTDGKNDTRTKQGQEEQTSRQAPLPEEEKDEPAAERVPETPGVTSLTTEETREEVPAEAEEAEEVDPELDDREDRAFLHEIEDSIRKNQETVPHPTQEEEPPREEREEKEKGKEPENNPYTGEDAELYQEIVESGQLSMEEIIFVMSNRIPTDYKRQLFMKMIENKLDEYD